MLAAALVSVVSQSGDSLAACGRAKLARSNNPLRAGPRRKEKEAVRQRVCFLSGPEAVIMKMIFMCR